MYSQEKERLDMTLMTLENVEVLKEIVECEVADLFTDLLKVDKVSEAVTLLLV